MKPISPVLPSNPQHPEVVFAKDQPQYLPLPAVNLRYADDTVTVVTRYRLSIFERLKLLFTGSVWLEQMTFGSPLQPQRPTLAEPLTDADDPNKKTNFIDIFRNLRALCGLRVRFPFSTSNIGAAELDLVASFKESGMQLSGIQSANAITAATTTPQNGWLLVAPFGEFPAPDRSYVQVFTRTESDEIVRSWNSMVGKAFRYVKNVRHKLKFRDTAPVFDHQYLEGHPDTDPANWSQLQELARVRDLRSSNAGLEALIEWDQEGMKSRNPGPLFPSIQWWHNPPNAEGKVFPGHFESITLTRTPNIASVPAWTTNANTKPNPMNEEQLKALRKALNQPETADVSTLIATAQSAYQLSTSNATALKTANTAKAELETKLTTANTDLQTANGKVTALEGEKTALTTEVAGLKTANGILVDGVLDAFELAGKITPAQRGETKTKFTANVAGSAAVITELKNKKPEMNTKHLELDGKRIDISTANARASALETAIGQRIASDKCTREEAFTKVQADPAYAQLFDAMNDPVRKAEKKAA